MEINQIYCADCLEFAKTLPSQTFDLIIADPPANGIVKDKWDNQWETEDQYVEWLLNRVIEFERLLKSNGSLYLYQWIGEKNPLTLAKVLLEINEKTKLHFKNIITWRKDRGFGVSNNWMYVREEILFYTKDKKNYTFNVQYGNIKRNYIRKCGKSYYKRPGNVWIEIQNEEFPCTNIFDDINESTYESISGQRKVEYSLDTKAPKIHSTTKPKELSKRIILSATNENDCVFIPFAGSGSEIYACKELNRNYVACENDKEIFENLRKMYI